MRLRRLEEAAGVVKGLLAAGPFTHIGEHYRVAGLEGLLGAAQEPSPSLLIGEGGRRLLSVAAREADIVVITAPTAPDGSVDPATITAAAMDEKVGGVRDAAGGRLSESEINVYAWFVAIIDDRRREAEEIAAEWAPLVQTLTPAILFDSPHALLGSVEQVAEQLQERRERWGASYVTVRDPAMTTYAPVVARLAGR